MSQGQIAKRTSFLPVPTTPLNFYLLFTIIIHEIHQDWSKIDVIEYGYNIILILEQNIVTIIELFTCFLSKSLIISSISLKNL